MSEQDNPVAWRYQDARGHYRYRAFVPGFDVEYASLKPVPLYLRQAPPVAEPALPEPFDYCYEWDGPYGKRKFSSASHNGARPARSVPIFRADQMQAYARAAIAADRAARVPLTDASRADAERWRMFLSTRPTETHEVVCAAIDAARTGSKT